MNFPPLIPFRPCPLPKFAKLHNEDTYTNTIMFDPAITGAQPPFFCDLHTRSGSNEAVMMDLTNPCTNNAGYVHLQQNTSTFSEAVRVGRRQGEKVYWATLIGNVRNKTRAEKAAKDALISFSSRPPNLHLLSIDCTQIFLPVQMRQNKWTVIGSCMFAEGPL